MTLILKFDLDITCGGDVSCLSSPWLIWSPTPTAMTSTPAARVFAASNSILSVLTRPFMSVIRIALFRAELRSPFRTTMNQSFPFFPRLYSHDMATEAWLLNLSNWTIRCDFTVCTFISFVIIWWHYFQGTILLPLFPWLTEDFHDS